MNTPLRARRRPSAGLAAGLAALLFAVGSLAGGSSAYCMTNASSMFGACLHCCRVYAESDINEIDATRAMISTVVASLG